MSYEFSDPNLKAMYERYAKDSAALHDLASDVALLRTLVQATVEANKDSPEKALKAVESGLSTLIKFERKLRELDLKESVVLHKAAVMRLGDAIVQILSQAILRHAPEARDRIVDEVGPLLATAIVDARNEPDDE